MSERLGPVDIEFVLKNVNFKQEAGKIKAEISGISQTAAREVSQTNDLMKSLGRGVAAYYSFQALQGLGQQLISVRGEFQQMGIALETMLGSKGKADALMSQVIDIAAKTPFSLTEVGQGAKQLLAFQVSQEDVIETLKRLGNVAAGVSVPIGRLITAYGQVKAKGRLMGDDLRQFTEAGIPMINELAKVFKTTDDKIAKMVETGKVGFADVQKVVANLTNEGGMFFNLMEKQSESLTGMVSNLGDAWDRMLNSIGESNEGLLADGIRGLTSLVENYEQVVEILKIVIATYGAYKAATIVNNIHEQARAVGSLTKALRGLAVVQGLINATGKLNPIGLAFAGITAIVGGLIAFNKHTNQAASAIDRINQSVTTEVFKLNSLFSAIKKAGSGTDERNRLIKVANDRYADYLPNLLSEKSSLDEIEKAQRRVTDALVANLAVKKAQEEIDELLSKSNERFKKTFEGKGDAGTWAGRLLKRVGKTFSDNYIEGFAEMYGSDRLPGMITALQEAVNKEVDASGEKLQRGVLEWSNIAAEFWNEWFKEMSQKTGYMKYSQREFIAAFLDVSEFNVKQKKPLSVLQAYYDSYSKILENFQKKNDDGGVITTPTSDDKFISDLELFERELKSKKEQYDEFEAYKKKAGEKNIKEFYSVLLEGGDTYADYLNNLFDSLGPGKKQAIVATEIVGLGNKDEQDYQKRLQDILDETATFNQKLDALENQYKEKRTILKKEGATENLEILTKQYEAERQALIEANKLKSESYAWVYQEIDRMSRAALREYIANLKKEIQAKAWSDEAKLMLSEKLAQAEQKLRDQLPETLQDVASVLRDAANLAGELDDNLAKAISTAADLASAAANIALGLASGNIFQVIGGGLQALTSLVRLGKDLIKGSSSYEKLLESIEKMNEALARQAKLIDSLQGEEKMNAFSVALQQVKQDLADIEAKLVKTGTRLQKMWLHWEESGSEWAKAFAQQMRGLGLIDKDVAEWSEQDWINVINASPEGQKKQLIALYDQWVELQQAQRDYFLQQAEYATGISFDSFVDEFLEALKLGERSAADFADNVEEMLRNAIIQGFKTKYLMEALEPWYKQFADMASDGLTPEEIEALRAKMQEIFGDAAEAFEALGDLGIDLSGAGDSANSLAGAIKGVTEETASIIAGRLNSMHLTMNESLRIAQRSVLHQAEIAANTRRLENIEHYLRDMKSGGNDNIRTKRAGGF